MPNEKTSIVAHVNLLWCAHQRVGGSEEYLIRQLAGLQQALSENDEPEISCTLHLGRRLAAERHELDSFTQVVSRCDVDRQATRVAIEHTALARATRAADLVHHGGGTLPIVRSSTPTVLTIHDLQYLRFPQYFSSSRRRYLQAMMPRSARVATTITTPTAHVADDVARSFSVDREKIVVVPHGVPTLTADPAEV
ncbi:MAG: glycosyltransferase, partial [Actinomycetota bacterium]|nr:glycosyltransferase [Actinomycetota bacterium]